VAPATEIRDSARHPYTQGLLRAFPCVHGSEVELSSIPGSPPSLHDPPRGCRFHPRCSQAIDVCREREPGLTPLGPGHAAACHLLTPPSG
jgi:oligopeptide/dipeptide ABC transporter ATP-binding protein